MCKYGIYSLKGHQVQNNAKKFGHAEPINDFNGLVHPDSSERTRQNGKDNSNFEGALPSTVIRDGVNQYV